MDKDNNKLCNVKNIYIKNWIIRGQNIKKPFINLVLFLLHYLLKQRFDVIIYTSK